MDKRKRIVLIYQYNENWIGGTYYIQNLIQALNYLPEFKKPLLKIICDTNEEFTKLSQLTNYPYLNRVPVIEKGSLKKEINIFFRILNKISRKLLGKNIFNDTFKDFDLLFPAWLGEKLKQKRFLYWIPDFQEHYLPAFFSESELDARANMQKAIVKTGKHIVFSSDDARNDFNNFYPQNNLKQFVLKFAVSHPLLNGQLSLDELRKIYNLPTEYFFCSNQFWIHKNQKVILQAVGNLKKMGKHVTVAFSGKEYDYRAPDYFDQLKKMVDDLDIIENVRFLGFIDRQEQLLLMKHAIAVIQPSLFEGWSTVIEDAKHLNLKIIVSNLRVHQEQLKNYPAKLFFDPEQPSELEASILAISNLTNPEFDYAPLIKQYGEKFLEIVEAVCSDSI